MTVIVFDGSTCAIDSAGLADTTVHPVNKFWISKDGKELITGAGNAPHVAALARWYQHGAFEGTFPPALYYYKDAELIVISQADGVRRYEANPNYIEHGQVACAFGEGRDFAYGALAAGAPAQQAAEIACQFSPACAGPVNVFYFEESGDVKQVGKS